MKIDKVNRRVFLQGVGGLLVAIPVLPSLMGKAEGATVIRNKRFLTMFPQSQLSHITFKVTEAMLSGIPYSNGYRSLALSSSNLQAISPLLGSKFNDYADQMSLVRGLYLGTLGHTGPGLLGNVSDCAQFDRTLPFEKTIDVLMAEARGLTADAILRIGTETNYYSPTYDGAATGVPLRFTNNGNPFLIYQNYFTNQVAVPANSTAAKKSLVDRIKNDLSSSLLNRGFISTADKKYLQDHMDFLNDLQKKYEGQTPVIACVPGTNTYFNTRPPTGIINMVNPDITKPADFKKFLLDSAKLMVEGVKCNIFNIGNLRVQSSFHDADVITGEKWHLEYAHGDNRLGLQKVHEWLLQNIYYEIIKGLDVEESNGQTFLDNSIVVYCPEFSESHMTYDLPLFLAGKGGGTVESGKFWDFADPGYQYVLNHPKDDDGKQIKYRAAIPFNRYWNSILQSWGLTPAQYEKVIGTNSNGSPIYRPGYGERDYLWNYKVAWHPPTYQNYIEANKEAYFKDIGKPLPGLFKIPT